MRPDVQEIAETYRHCTNREIASLAGEMETLTDVARGALAEEIHRRGMGGPDLEKLHARELQREARTDRLEKERRKQLALYLLTRNDPKGMISIILVALGFAVVVWVRSLLH